MTTDGRHTSNGEQTAVVRREDLLRRAAGVAGGAV